MSKPSGIWVLAEQSGGRVRSVSHELLARGRLLADALGTELAAMIFGHRLDAGDLRELIERGADRVVVIEDPQLEHFLVEPYAACMGRILEQYQPEVVIAGATTLGRTLMPYVAVKVNAGLTADCTELAIEKETGDLLQTRPAIGGNILATIKTPERRPQMATVRPHSVHPASRTSGRRGRIERLTVPAAVLASRVRRVGFEPAADSHGLQDAEIVVAVGRGIKKPEHIAMIRRLAEAMGAALGASRDVVDRGWLSYPHQIGLSGKTIMPKLYLGVGVSGSVQHLAGMQTSETIVAINLDPEAQIFRVADFGIVGDLFAVVPVLTEKICRAKGKP